MEPTVREEEDNVEDNDKLLWQRLDSKYGNQRKYIDIIISDLSRISKGDGKASLNLINTVEKALVRIAAEQEMCNSSIISMIEKKLPEEMRFEWIKTIAERGEIDSSAVFRLLMAFLTKWRQIIEYDEAAIRKAPEKKVGATHYTGSRQERLYKSEVCWVHEENGNHPVWKCKAFQALSIKDKLDLVRQKQACQACLETNCKGSKNPEE